MKNENRTGKISIIPYIEPGRDEQSLNQPWLIWIFAKNTHISFILAAIYPPLIDLFLIWGQKIDLKR